jgi:hypothetical protein
MFKDIDRYVNKCKICALAGKESVNTRNNVIKPIGESDLWEVDLIGPIKGCSGKDKYIFAAINHFNKWVEARVIRYKSKITVIQCVEDLIINKHGAPNLMLSDANRI